ncbi:MAG: cation:proton antiporter [Muribaculaceae bacterium]|nr:cation:proton antiporter [Muribaculaceae bacterium]
MKALVTDPVAIFLIVLTIILLAPVILNKLKIPHIIGMIVAGVAVGPFGLHILDRDSSFAIFGQVGLLYLMFLAGLEIDMYHLRRNMRRGVLFGLLTFFIPMAMGVLASVYILRLGWLTSFLLASMYASHTLIAYPVAARFGLTKSPAVLISVVGTIIAVVGALLVLAGAVNIHDHGSFQPSNILFLLGRLALYAAAVLYSYPRVTRWFFKRYGEKVTQYVFVLVIVFLSAWISDVIGLEPVLGAFFAGLVLNRYIPANSPLMNSIEFVGNALFIPYFLIGVGMMINVSVITSGSTLAVAAVMLAVALVSKWLAAWAAQKAYRMQAPDREMMFGLTTAHTAVALAVVTIGYNMLLPDGSRMMDETILNGTVLVILVTCAVAPISTARAAAKIKVRELQEGEADTSRHRHAANTLIAVSNPLTAAPLVEMAMMMRMHKSGIDADRLFALHVRNDNTPSAKAVGEHAIKLAAAAAAGADSTLEPIERFDINPVTGIINTVQERDITQVIVGMHRKATVIDTFLGSRIEQLLKGTNKMILISRCYIPVNTVTRIVVSVPPMAEYETGFERWVLALGALASEVGCRIIFCCHPSQQHIIKGVIRRAGLGIRHEYRDMTEKDDFVLLANRVLDDDLLVVVAARPNSVSHSADMADAASLLQRYFSRNNLCIIYPEQFGQEPQLPTFTDPLGSDIATTPSPLWLMVRDRLHRVNALKKRLTHRRRTPRI